MNILNQKIKPITFSLLLATSTFASIADAGVLSANRSIFSSDTGTIRPQITFNQAESGDLYLATRIEGNLYFILNNGNLSSTPVPYLSNQEFNGIYELPQFNTAGMPPGQYPLYQVITYPGSDVMNFTNWIGGIGALNVINFSVGLENTITGDFDSDGWPDDDQNHDGFHDDDHNKDGYHDDDHNHDGFHDDDINKDGHHDHEDESEYDNNKIESDDSENGSHDNELDDNDTENESYDNELGDNENDPHDDESDDGESESHDDESGDNQNASNNDQAVNNENNNSTTTSSTLTNPEVVSSITRGKLSYENSCSSCHETNPLNNGNDILRAKNAAASRSAISRNKGGMGFLTNSDSDLQDIADYINSLTTKEN